MGIGGTSLVWAKVSAGATSGVGTEVLPDGDVYAIDFGKDYIGLSTLDSLLLVMQYGSIMLHLILGLHILSQLHYPKVTTKVERFFGEVGVSSAHGLETGDLITLETLPQSTESTKLRYDPVIALK